jgi:hypothetical protein
MNIEPIGRIDSNSTPLIELLQVFQMTQSHRQTARAAEVSGLTYLTAADREFLTAIYGPAVLTIAATDAEQVRTPQFLLDVIEDRMGGHLPIGTELTSTYVHTRFDAHADRKGMIAHPLTERNLLDAQAFFDRRVQGAAIDVQA